VLGAKLFSNGLIVHPKRERDALLLLGSITPTTARQHYNHLMRAPTPFFLLPHHSHNQPTRCSRPSIVIIVEGPGRKSREERQWRLPSPSSIIIQLPVIPVQEIA